MSQPFLFLLLCLASFRITRFLIEDTFPPMLAVRRWVIERLEESPWAEVVICGWCMGVWVAAATILVATPFLTIQLPFLQFLGVAAVTGLLLSFDHG